MESVMEEWMGSGVRKDWDGGIGGVGTRSGSFCKSLD